MRWTGLLSLLLLVPVPGAARAVPDRPRSWEEVATFHFRQYPGMEVADLYKLVFQGTFGVRHLWADPGMAREYLLRELAEIPARPGELWTPISPESRMIRVELEAFKARGLSVDRLLEAVRRSAEANRATARDFTRAWQRLTRWARRGGLPVPVSVMREWGRQPVDPLDSPHHSPVYEQLYRPHYRVVERTVFARLFPGSERGRPSPARMSSKLDHTTRGEP